MRECIELNRDLPSVAIAGHVMHELCSHALDAVPEECCGLISGGADEPFRAVHRITNVMTRMHLSDAKTFPRDAHHAYYMSDVEYLQAQREAESRGERITAVYHSHVGADAYLSLEDLAYAEHPFFPFPEAAQIVLSVLDNRVKTAAIFEVDGKNGGFNGVGGRLLEVAQS